MPYQLGAIGSGVKLGEGAGANNSYTPRGESSFTRVSMLVGASLMLVDAPSTADVERYIAIAPYYNRIRTPEGKMRSTADRSKRPNEQFPYGVNFTNDLEPGDIGITLVVTSSVGGVDSTATHVAESQIIEAGTVAVATIRGGVAGTTISVVFRLSTAAGRIYEHELLIPVATS